MRSALFELCRRSGSLPAALVAFWVLALPSAGRGQDVTWTSAGRLEISGGTREWLENEANAPSPTNFDYSANGFVVLAKPALRGWHDPAGLHSAASVNVSLDGWNTAQLMGVVTTRRSDSILVVPRDGYAAGIGKIEFVWQLDGLLSTAVRSPGGWPLTGRTGSGGPIPFWDWGYHVKAELSAEWTEPNGAPREQLITRQQMSRTVADVELSEEAQNFEKFIEIGLAKHAIYPAGVTEAEDRRDVNIGNAAFAYTMVAPGAPIDVTFGLTAGYSLVFMNTDYGPLDGAAYTVFENTASLLGVRAYAPDGSLYEGEWSIQSANGVDYPILAVPEPNLASLAMLGVTILLARRRPRSPAHGIVGS